MASTSVKKTFPLDQLPVKVLVLTYPEMDVLDIVGPLEGFSRAVDSNEVSVFKPTIAGVSPRSSTGQWVSIAPDIDYESALQTCGDYDLLLVPGGPTTGVVKPLLRRDGMVVKIIEKFSKLERGEDQKHRPRILMSICTGSFFLAYLGLFLPGWECTTHYQTKDDFEAELYKHSRGAKYVETTYVNSGYLKNGINVIDSGGISNGIDAGLYLIWDYFDVPQGTKLFKKATEIMDYRNMVRCGIPCMPNCNERPPPSN